MFTSESSKSFKSYTAMLAAIFVLTAVAFSTFILFESTENTDAVQPDTVEVPNFVGFQASEVYEFAAAHNLEVSELRASTVADPALTAGDVLTQYPKLGEVIISGDTVTIVTLVPSSSVWPT